MSSSSSATACTWASSAPTATAWIETPHLDRLAAEGVVFDHHFPENLTTLPTRRSWWTGRYGFADPDAGLDPAPARRADPARPALEPGGPHGLDLRRPAAPRGRPRVRPRVRRGASGSAGQGYDPLVPAGRPPRGEGPARGRAGAAAPPEDDPDYELWKGRWEQYLRNRAGLRTEVEENTGVARTVRCGDRLAGAPGRPPRSVHALARPVQPARALGPAPALSRPVRRAPSPTSSRPARKGTSSRTWKDPEIDLEEVPVLIDVPAGAVGDVIDEAELLRLRRTYAGTVTLVDRWLGVLFDALKTDGADGRHPARLHERPGRAAGRARLRPPVPPLALRGADPHAADRPDARRGPRGRPAPGARADGRPAADDPLGARPAADRTRSTATTCCP